MAFPVKLYKMLSGAFTGIQDFEKGYTLLELDSVTSGRARSKIRSEGVYSQSEAEAIIRRFGVMITSVSQKDNVQLDDWATANQFGFAIYTDRQGRDWTTRIFTGTARPLASHFLEGQYKDKGYIELEFEHEPFWSRWEVPIALSNKYLPAGTTALLRVDNNCGPGVLTAVQVTNGGSGYTSAPTVSFSIGGSGAAATAYLSYVVADVTVSNGGSGYTSVPTVVFSGGGGSGAAAVAAVSNGVVTRIFITNRGIGYTSPPTVTLTGGGGSGATAYAATAQGVDHVTVTNGGSGYTSVPTVVFSGGSGSGASAVAVISGGVVTAVNMVSNGVWYMTTPTVSFSVSGNSATAVAVVSGGAVVRVDVTNGGNSYTSVPTVNFSGGGGSGATAVAYFANGVNYVGLSTRSENWDSSGPGDATMTTNLQLYNNMVWPNNISRIYIGVLRGTTAFAGGWLGGPVVVTWSGTAEQQINNYDIANATLQLLKGRYARPMIRFQSPVLEGDLEFQFRLNTPYGNVWASQWLKTEQYRSLQKGPEVPFTLANIQNTPYKDSLKGTTLRLVMRRLSGAATTARIADLHLLPLDGWREYRLPGYPITDNDSLWDYGNWETTFHTNNNEAIAGQVASDGDRLTFDPEDYYTICVLTEQYNSSSYPADTMQVRLWGYPRRRSI